MICWKIDGRFCFLRVVSVDSSLHDRRHLRSGSMGDSGFLVRTGVLDGFDDVCRAHGLRAAALLDELGLPPEVLEDPNLYMPRSKNVALFNLAAERSSCPTFGLELATRQDSGVLGALSHLIFRGSTVEESLALARQYLTYHLRGADFTHRQLDDTWSVVELELGNDVVPETRVSADFTIVHVARLLRRLCGEGYQPAQIRMTHPEPADLQPYDAVFAAPIVWDQPVLAIVLPTASLALPPAEVPDIKTFLLEYVETVSAPLDPDHLGAQTRAVLRSLIGRTSASVEVVAAAMGMHVRDLQRELRGFGLSFRELRDEVYCEYACGALRHPDTVVSELAATLDYSDASAFSRAFKKWTGVSPTAWRQALND